MVKDRPTKRSINDPHSSTPQEKGKARYSESFYTVFKIKTCRKENIYPGMFGKAINCF